MSHLYLCGEPGCQFQTEDRQTFFAHAAKHEQAEAERNLERISRRNAGLKGARE